MRVTLPLPPKLLSPNARTHWAARARAVKWYRTTAWLRCRQVIGQSRPRWDRAEVRVVFMLPDKRRRDPDNLMSSLKAGWDGFVDAGLLSDDKGLVLYPPVLMVDRAEPRVEIEIVEATA